LSQFRHLDGFNLTGVVVIGVTGEWL